MEVVYLCDRKACGDECPSPNDCSHTFDISHAVNFQKLDDYKYIEKETSKTRGCIFSHMCKELQ